MSFAASTARFASQAARQLQTLSPATVQPYTSAGAEDGNPVDVFLGPVRAVRELGDAGFIIIRRATLRVLKACRWQPAEGIEFVNTATSERFRCNTAIGAGSDFAAETVCEVVKISG